MIFLPLYSHAYYSWDSQLGELQDLQDTIRRPSWRQGRKKPKLGSHVLLDTDIWAKLYLTKGVGRNSLL